MNLTSHVVVVEDQLAVRTSVCRLLTKAGFGIVEVADAREAIAVLQLKSATIHVLFSDIHMPGAMNGLMLAHHVYIHWPWIGLLLTSGKANPTAAEMPAGCRFIPKPYRPRHLTDHVRELAVASRIVLSASTARPN